MGNRVLNLSIKFTLTTAIAVGYIILYSGCYTKKKAIEKFCRQDSIRVDVTIYDTILTETIKVDTFFSSKIDSFTLVKDRLVIRYIRKNDTTYLSGKCIGDTIYIEKKVPVALPVNCPTEDLSFNEWFDRQNFFVQLGFILIFISALLFVAQTILSWFNKRASS